MFTVCHLAQQELFIIEQVYAQYKPACVFGKGSKTK